METTFNDTDVTCFAKTKASPGEQHTREHSMTLNVYNVFLFEQWESIMIILRIDF